MDNIDISILVPVYNSEDYIEECLDSLVKQSLDNYEIVVLDDGSTDNSALIINKYANAYSNVYAYHQTNSGIVQARCKLLQLARGNYVGWVDSDDFVDRNMFLELLTLAKEENADISFCNYDFYPSSIKTKKKWYKPYKGVVNWKFLEQNTQQWNKIIKKDLLDKLDMPLIMSKCGEGAYAFAFLFATNIISTDKELYHYRVGHSSLSTNLKNISWYKTNVEKTKRQVEIANQLRLDADMLNYFDYWLIYAQLQLVIVTANCCKREEYQREVANYYKLKPNNNYYTKAVLDNNYGKLKSFVMRKLIPSNYYMGVLITKIALR